MAKSSKKQNQTATPSNQPAPSTKPPPSPIASVEVNAIQSNESARGNKKGKNKSKKSYNQQAGNKTKNSDTDSKGKRKVKYPCLMFGGCHFTKECPHHEEVSKFLKTSPTPAVLKDPFPSQQ